MRPPLSSTVAEVATTDTLIVMDLFAALHVDFAPLEALSKEVLLASAP